MCQSCTSRPEMIRCSQCRTPLYAQNGTKKITRNRALEELARKTFPAVQGEPAVVTEEEEMEAWRQEEEAEMDAWRQDEEMRRLEDEVEFMRNVEEQLEDSEGDWYDDGWS